MKNLNKRILVLLAVLLTLATVLALAACTPDTGKTTSVADTTVSDTTVADTTVADTTEKVTFPEEIGTGAKAVTVKVVDDKQNTITILVHTDAQFLRGVLEEAGLVAATEDSYIKTVAGITADYDRDESWWCILLGENMTQLGASEQPVQDGEVYTLVYKIGF